METKLYIPNGRPDLVSRPRLIERLHQGLQRKLTLVSAPAGFGKTTLLAEWLAATPAGEPPAAWVPLDPGDNDPAFFWAYFIAALQKIQSGVGESALSLLHSPRTLESVLTTLINEINGIEDDPSAGSGDGFVLVLDDYHAVDAQPVHSAINFLLDHLPPQMHLVIASRSDPPLPLETWPETGFSRVVSYTWGIKKQRGLEHAGRAFGPEGPLGSGPVYLDHVGRESFYGLLASLRGQLFRDADFAEFYCPDNGRDSVPPSLLATALLLQSHDKVSDAEAKARADFDLRWKVALGIEAEDRPFAKSTLQVFRAQLILHGKVREVFESSLRLARESGWLKGRGIRVALDTTNILGRGAVKDTCNLLADGIVKLLRTLAAVEQVPVREWAKAQGYKRYLGSSVKGEAAIDWSDKRARTALLAKIVADADRLLELSRQAQGGLAEDGEERQRIVAAAELLGQLLLQDVDRAEGGVSLKDGVSRDRMMSVHDPEMRHGHKSSSKRFDGHKAAIVVDTDSQLITAVDVLPGNAPDNLGALELVEQSEANTGVPVEEAMGDAAYGDGDTRQAFADAGRRLVARVPGRPDRKHFPKDDFVIDLAAGSCTCPAGQVTHTIVPAGKRTGRTGRVHRLQAFQFDGAECRTCPLRSQCIAAKGSRGRRG